MATIINRSEKYLRKTPVSGELSNPSISTKADIDSEILTGTPRAPTAAHGTSTTQIATTEFVTLNGVPSGVIAMWSGAVTAVPDMWFLCDGTNGTPDLRGRFIYGASVDGDVNTVGGSADAIVVSHTHTTPDHTHTGSSNSTGAHNHPLVLGGGSSGPRYAISVDASTGAGHSYGTEQTGSAGAHSHTITVDSGGAGTTGTTGSSGTNANLPPYMKLAYIMKG